VVREAIQAMAKDAAVCRTQMDGQMASALRDKADMQARLDKVRVLFR
jgi:hypothetical protein